MGANATVFDRLNALADATRSRLLLLLDGHELTVSELCAVLQLPQSTVSRHLKVLGDEGWVASRAEGTSRLYRMARDLDTGAVALWQVVRAEAAGAVGEDDLARLRSVLAERRSRSREFFSTAAGSWDATKAELFGERPDLLALAGVMDPGWTVGDLGCGTGQLAVSLAPFVKRVVAVDESAAMLEAARARVAAIGEGAVELRQGTLESLPVADGELDLAVLSLVLHYVVEPAAVLAEAARTLRLGGRVLVLDMLPHPRAEYRERMGHVWQGFGAAEFRGWLAAAGFQATRYVTLPADPRARGPRLFVATGEKG